MTTTESNIRKKARRRGFTLSKYKKGYGYAYILKVNDSPICDLWSNLWEAELSEVEAFIDKQPILGY